MNIIETLNWRYATKRMTGEKVPAETLNQILESIRMAPTSYGLQPFGITVIEDKELIETIYEKACPQIVIKQCSELLVFRARIKIDNDLVDGYVDEMVASRNSSEAEVDSFRNKIKLVQENPSINKLSWAMRQTYIALGYATLAAAMLGVDTTPIEGFNPPALNEVLEIDTEKEEAVVMLALGYRDEAEDRSANQIKVRRSADKMFVRI